MSEGWEPTRRGALAGPDAARQLALAFQLEQSQWWPPELIKARQRTQLQQVLAHARHTVPFYADRIPDLDPRAPHDPERWQRIPILSRQDLQLNQASLLSRAVPPAHGSVHEVSSSGSTGRPITVHITDYVSLLWQVFTLREHYHVQSENLLIEILDQSGAPCGPGEAGRVVVTTLHNFATPLIRYDIGDYAQPGVPCPCGRGLAVIERILGRVRNMLVLTNGERYWPSMNLNRVHRIAPILQLQSAQVRLNELEIRLVVRRPLTRLEESALIEHIGANLPDRLEIVLRYVGEIPRSAAGKFEQFVCELPA